MASEEVGWEDYRWVVSGAAYSMFTGHRPGDADPPCLARGRDEPWPCVSLELR